MKRLLIAILILPKLIFSEENDLGQKEIKPPETSVSAEPNFSSICNFESDPSAIVGNVNVITGDYLDSTTDIILPGPEPLILQRCYCSTDPSEGTFMQGWNHNLFGHFLPPHCMDWPENARKFATLSGAFGSRVEFEQTDKNGQDLIYKLRPYVIKKNLTNCGQNEISARTNRKNMVIAHHKKGTSSIMRNGAGLISHFEERKLSHSKPGHFLRREIKPNGNEIKYAYDSKDRIHKVETCNKDGEIFAWLRFDYPKKNKDSYEKNPTVVVETSDGRKIKYRYEERKVKKETTLSLIAVENPNRVTEKYIYGSNAGDELEDHKMLTKKFISGDRCLITSYYNKETNDVGNKSITLDKHDRRYNRVKLQKAPVGPDNAEVIVRRFFYHFNNEKRDRPTAGYTDVRDALNHKITYGFNDDNRLIRINWFTGTKEGDHKRYKTERFRWGLHNSSNETQLMLRSILNSEGEAIAVKTFKYDKKGNVTRESTYGNLTGEGSDYVKVEKNEYPTENSDNEHFDVHYHYSKDDYNLLIEEIHPNDKKILYTYYENSDLLKSKHIHGANDIHLREFYKYNKDAILIKKIVDDGFKSSQKDLSGVQQRLITYFTPKKEAPCRGFSEEIVEKYLDIETGQEKLLKRITQVYDNFGHLLSQSLYDSNDQFLYTLTWKYDDLANVIEETDALGNVITKRYDANKNLIFQQGPRQDFYKEFIYDLSSRLICEKIIQSDGKSYSTSYKYDYLGNRVTSIDLNENRTAYVYDEFKRIIETRSPNFMDESGNVSKVTEKFEYDLMGNPIKQTDRKGNVTRNKHNIRKQITEIVHPDGSSERNIYDLLGNLKKHIAINGVYTLYNYDSLNRPITKKTFSPDHELLTSTNSIYNSMQLIEERDEQGIVTHHKYDGVGRLIETRRADVRTTKHYNAQGLVSEERQWLSESAYTSKIHVYDLAGNVIEERTEDQDGIVYKKQQMQYDEQYNCIATILERNGINVTTSTTFDALKRTTSIVDSEGNTTFLRYNQVVNEMGQTVLEKTTIDPLGNQQVELCDAIGQLVKTSRKNCKGDLLQQRKFYYDLVGNLVRTEDSQLPSDSTIINNREYDASKRLIRLVQGFNTPEQKETQWTYNEFGQKSSYKKADGIVINYTYDWQGRLKTVISSDNSIHYIYSYDNSGFPVEVKDLIHDTSTKRSYNINKQLSKEVLAHGISVEYEYDTLNKPLSITLEDRRIVYTYQGPHIHTIERQALNGTVLYRHTYDDFDLTGAPLNLTLAKDCGTLSYQYDNSGRITGIDSPFYTQKDIKYDAVGNIESFSSQDIKGLIEYAYHYDELYQLTDEAGGTSHHYNFDSLYNRLQKDNENTTFNALNQIQCPEISYDINGNMISKGDVKYQYDAWDRLVHVTTPECEAFYTYDELNRRVTKTLKNASGKTSEKYLYLDMNEVGHVDDSNHIASFRVLGIGAGAEIGASVALEINDEVYIPIHDNNGNIVALSNGETHHYSAFGQESILNSEDNSPNRLSPWQYASKRYDTESNLVYFGRRFYDPSLGRWLNPDPTGERDSPNLYAYVLNSPLTHYDLYGLYVHRDNLFEEPKFPPPVSYTFGDYFECFFPLSSGRSGLYDLGIPNVPGIGLIYVNGMDTTYAQSRATAEYFSKMSGGYNVNYVCNLTHGKAIDIVESAFGLCHKATAPVRLTQMALDRFFRDNPKNGECLLICHSQGAIHTLNALLDYPSELTKRVHVIAVAPAAYIYEQTCKTVVHYRVKASRDLVPRIDVGGAIRARDTIIELESHPSADLHDHGIHSKTYEPSLRYDIMKFIINQLRDPI